MKNPKNPVFSDNPNLGGLTKEEYVFIEVLKSLISPDKFYAYTNEEQLKKLIGMARLITKKVFEQ